MTTTLGKTNKEKAFEMFKHNSSDDDVVCELGLTESTVKSYRSKYRKTIGQSIYNTKSNIENNKEITKKATKKNIKEIQEKGINISALISEYNYIQENICMIIGKDVYDISYYIDIRDGSNWFDYTQIITVLIAESIIASADYSHNMSERYFRDESINDKSVRLVDRNALMELAQNIGDYTFINAVISLYTSGNKDVFFRFNQIMDALELIEYYISNDHIDKKYNEVGAYNLCQSDFLHEEIDNDPFATEEQLLEKMQKLKNLRLSRRTAKNELVLSQSLRNNLRCYKVNCAQIHSIRTKVTKLVDDLYAKKYTPKLGSLDEYQRDVADKVIDNEYQLEAVN